MFAHDASPIGTIEGFFGRPWTHQQRLDHLDFLSRCTADFYLYAPKSDPHLRRDWQTNWNAPAFAELMALRTHARASQLQFGVGLSPFGAHTLTPAALADALQARFAQIAQLKPDILGIFFDDMRGDTPHLARTQLTCVTLARDFFPQTRIIFCPTYYSFDPVLERVFGASPAHYFEDLKQGLPEGVDYFWTGEQVCSRSYSHEHLAAVSQLLGKAPFIWDNYPVNDGAKKSEHLYLEPVDASLWGIAPLIAGRAINPMNQAYLSQFALSSSIAAHRNQPQIYRDFLAEIPAELRHVLLSYKALFAQQGRGEIGGSIDQQLRFRLAPFLKYPYTQEVLEWLDGGYQFDPACLTD